MKARIGIVDYEAGNTASVLNALHQMGVQAFVSSQVAELDSASGIILPGVGAAPRAMESLEKSGLPSFLKEYKGPLLGICLGMQLFFESSEEGPTETLSLLKGQVRRFDATGQKVPQMGWNHVSPTSPHSLFQGIEGGGYFYFAHSYFADVIAGQTIAQTQTSASALPYTAALFSNNRMGVQFHPEKSGPLGLRLLKNFEALCKSSRR